MIRLLEPKTLSPGVGYTSSYSVPTSSLPRSGGILLSWFIFRILEDSDYGTYHMDRQYHAAGGSHFLLAGV